MSRCRWDLEPQSRFRGSGRPTGTHLSAFAGPPLIWTTLGKSKFHSFPLYSVYCMFTYSTPSRPEVTLSVIFGKIRTLGKSKFHSLPMYIQRILYALSLWSYIVSDIWRNMVGKIQTKEHSSTIIGPPQNIMIMMRCGFHIPLSIVHFLWWGNKAKISFRKFDIKELRLRGYHDSPIQAQRWTNRKLKISKFLSNNFYTWDALPYKRRRSLRQFDNR